MGVLIVDIHEPTEIARLIEPVLDIDVLNINESGLMDFKWTGEIEQPFAQVERKTWADISTPKGLDEVEEQVRRQVRLHPEALNRFLLEGAMEPAPGGVMVYAKAGGRDMMNGRLQATAPGHYKRIMAWLADLAEYMEIIPTSSYAGTATAIIALYERDNDPNERMIFKRHFKTITWNPNAQVVKLLGITANHEPHWGVKICERLVKRFGTVYAVCSASPQQLGDVEGISTASAVKFLRAIGRLDV